jgi:NitT/TauT family transport system substrate-binding protein
MVEACVRGWQDYLADPEPTNRLIHERNTRIDMEALAFGAREVTPLIEADEARVDGVGWMTLARWQELEKQLVDSGQLAAGAVDPSKSFTTEFLPTPKSAESAE